MSIPRVRTWSPGDILTAADLNAEFNNVVNNLPSIADSSLSFVTATNTLTNRRLNDRFADLINVKDYDVTNDGVETGAKITSLISTISGAGGGTLWFPRGTYTYATSPNFAATKVSILCERGATFNHTGTGSAFVLDGGAAGGGVFGNSYENIRVQGNASSTHGIYLRAIHHCQFHHPQVLGCSTTGAAFQLEWCVANAWNTPESTTDVSPIPLYGMYLTRRGVGENTTTQNVRNPIFEGLSNTNGAGIYLDYANSCQFANGTSEANYNGIFINSHGAGLNTFFNIDLEANSNHDFILDGAVSNSFISILTLGSSSIIDGANRNNFYGGWLSSLTIDDASSLNAFHDVQFLTALTDNSTVGNLYQQCTNPAASPTFSDKNPNNVLTTGALPAPSAMMDGTVVIENGGLGNGNLVIYVGGQRFRIDGGAAF